jgi:hypothetical protein
VGRYIEEDKRKNLEKRKAIAKEVEGRVKP